MRLAAILLAALALADASVGVPADAGTPGGAARAGAAYALADYLRDVEAGSPALAASRENQASFGAKAGETDLMYTPFLSGAMNWVDDRREPSSSFSPARTLAEKWSVGLGQRLRTGTSIGLSYGMNYTKLFSQAAQPLPGSMAAFAPLLTAMESAFLPLPSYDARASVTVSQSIWKELVLRSTEAANDRIKAAAGAGSLGERFRAAAVRFQAEEVYWRLGLLRRVLAAKQASLERTKKMEAWAARRVESNLGDQSDLLQARAGVRLRELDMRGAEQDLLAAQRAFNALRGRDGSEVPETLEEIAERAKAEPATPVAPAGDRLDVRAAAEMLKAARLGAREAVGRTSADFSVFGSAAFNGHDSTLPGATSEGFTVDHPSWMAGGVVTVPLGFGRIAKVRNGYEADVRGAEDGLARARLDAAREWKDLLSRWAEVTERMGLAEQLETLQREKAVREQERYATGRTTMFQVLAFEDDLSNAQLLTLRVGYERLVLSAQARMYGAP
ncbi:MAG: TolC family protein [Candidatus Coatesbacteria bacterium]